MDKMWKVIFTGKRWPTTDWNTMNKTFRYHSINVMHKGEFSEIKNILEASNMNNRKELYKNPNTKK